MTGHPKHRDPKALRKKRISRMLWIAVMVATIFVVTALFSLDDSAAMGSQQVFSAGGELKIEHDEAIMLLISLIVITEIITSFSYIRFIPYKCLLLSSFFMFVLSAVITVVETFFFEEVLNYVEHLSLLVSAILLAVWCGRVFLARKQEGI